MSVQTQIDRISTEVTTQETLLDQALALIEGKAAGGGGSGGGTGETCTVTVNTELYVEYWLYNVGSQWIAEAPDLQPGNSSALTVAVGSILLVAAWSTISDTVAEITGDISIHSMNGGYLTFNVNGSGTIALVDAEVGGGIS